MSDRKKFILIDGNSLLNRAYYAMSVFTTKDGLPTNGIFGFVKLVLKILDEQKPEYLAVAFDLHAPTFRHKLYPEYKGTRRPMPEELVVQVPVLKDLLSAMRIRTVELEGYEADDLLGTLSRRFDGVECFIYTGDRDAYQLVREGVNVCFTRRGVSDIDLLTAENFREKTGLTPEQIIEEKAIMGDASDNIPGVKGVGPKGALTLLQSYGTLDGVYEHLGEIPAGLRQKLTASEASARLSRTLATIDTDVPIDVTLESCRCRLPFPEAAREFFARLEFRSLVNAAYFPEERKATICAKEVSVPEALRELPTEGDFSVCLDKNECHIWAGETEYIFRLRDNFLMPGLFFGELRPLFEALFRGNRRALVPDKKALSHRLDELKLSIECPCEDVSLLRYLADSNVRPSGPLEFGKDFALPAENCAYGVKLAYEEARRKTDGTPEERLYRELELPLEDVLLDMERTGVRVDTDMFPEFSEKFNRELNDLSARIFELAGVDSFNLNSPFQLSEVLFEKLGYDARGVKRNQRGGYSTSAEVLERLAEKYEIARLILRYREIQKLQSTYIDGIRPLVTGGVVHTTYNQTMTTTGRLSSANPNLQNIPVRTEAGKELRKLFLAREGNLLVDADYSQIELRLLAHCSECKALIQAYNEGADIHAATASRVFGVPLGEVTPALRRRAKTINFGIIYGMSAFGLAKDLGCSTPEAQETINRYFASYPEVKEYMDENVRFAKENGFVKTIFGRKRFIPEIRSSNYNIRSFGERAAMNMPLQGSAADIIKIAMLNVARRIDRDGANAKMVLQVHDELILDVPAGECDAAAKLLKEEMERAAELRVPLIAEVSVGRSWYDAK